MEQTERNEQEIQTPNYMAPETSSSNRQEKHSQKTKNECSYDYLMNKSFLIFQLLYRLI